MTIPPPRRIKGLGPGITVRRAHERGHTSNAWLDSRHTFAFGTYDRVWAGLGALKVLNEDRLEPGGGFAEHPHWDMEIVTWVIEGELQHRDSTGATARLRAGEVQRITAGTGVEHAERNASDVDPLRLFQLWIVPARKGLPPGHEHRGSFGRADGGLTLLASGEPRPDALLVHQDVSIYAGFVDAGATRELPLPESRRGWLQLADGSLHLDDVALGSGDGAAIIERPAPRLRATTRSRFLFIDLACVLAALIAAGSCRAAPAPAPAAVAGATSPATSAAPDAERACLEAIQIEWAELDEVLPEAPVVHAVAVEDERVVCAAEVLVGDPSEAVSGMMMQSVAVRLGVVARTGRVWRLVDSDQTTYQEGRDDQGGIGTAITVEALPIRAGQTAVLVTMSQGEDGPEYGSEDTEATLYVVVDDQLSPVYQASWAARTGEADHVEQRTITLADTSTDGVRDLAVEVYRREVEWATGGHCPVEYTIAERWTWQDGSYALVDAEEPPKAEPCDDPSDSGDDDVGDDVGAD